MTALWLVLQCNRVTEDLIVVIINKITCTESKLLLSPKCFTIKSFSSPAFTRFYYIQDKQYKCLKTTFIMICCDEVNWTAMIQYIQHCAHFAALSQRSNLYCDHCLRVSTQQKVWLRQGLCCNEWHIRSQWYSKVWKYKEQDLVVVVVGGGVMPPWSHFPFARGKSPLLALPTLGPIPPTAPPMQWYLEPKPLSFLVLSLSAGLSFPKPELCLSTGMPWAGVCNAPCRGDPSHGWS